MAALTEWVSLRRKKARIEAERDRELTPIRERFEQECAPILAKYGPKLSPVDDALTQLEAAIREAVLGAKGADGSHKLPRVASAAAVVEVATRTVRDINPQAFFKLFTPADQDSGFWGCFTVLVGKAEKLLGGARLDEVATPKQTHSVTIKEL